MQKRKNKKLNWTRRKKLILKVLFTRSTQWNLLYKNANLFEDITILYRPADEKSNTRKGEKCLLNRSQEGRLNFKPKAKSELKLKRL